MKLDNTCTLLCVDCRRDSTKYGIYYLTICLNLQHTFDRLLSLCDIFGHLRQIIVPFTS